MEIRLYEAIKNADSDEIRKIILDFPYYLESIIDQRHYGTTLHVAAKYDTRNGSNVVQLLLDEFNADVGITNTSDSIPLYWAFAEMNKSEFPNVSPAYILLNSPGFYINKTYPHRGKCLDFIKEVYYPSRHGRTIKELVEANLWNSKRIVILLRLKLHVPLV